MDDYEAFLLLRSYLGKTNEKCWSLAVRFFNDDWKMKMADMRLTEEILPVSLPPFRHNQPPFQIGEVFFADLAFLPRFEV